MANNQEKNVRENLIADLKNKFKVCTKNGIFFKQQLA
jgi:hypothetical protein